MPYLSANINIWPDRFLFETYRKDKPVEVFIIKDQPPSAQAKILHLLKLLEKYGPQSGLPHPRTIDHIICTN